MHSHELNKTQEIYGGILQQAFSPMCVGKKTYFDIGLVKMVLPRPLNGSLQGQLSFWASATCVIAVPMLERAWLLRPECITMQFYQLREGVPRFIHFSEITARGILILVLHYVVNALGSKCPSLRTDFFLKVQQLERFDQPTFLPKYRLNCPQHLSFKAVAVSITCIIPTVLKWRVKWGGWQLIVTNWVS